MSLAYEPLSTEHWADPYPVYRELRDEAPLYRAPKSGIVCLSRHEDVECALRNPLVFSSTGMDKILFGGSDGLKLGLRDWLAVGRFMIRARVNPIRFPRPQNLVTLDPPKHDAMRAVVNRGFTPRRISALEPRMRSLAAEAMIRLEGGDDFDVIRDLAIPLPVTVIANMLGVHEDRLHDFKRWSDALISAASGANRGARLATTLNPMGELRGYVRGIVRARRAQPRDDLISVLVDPKNEDTLSENEIFGFIALLLVAGNETTTNLIGNSTLALLAHPEELEKVQTDPSLVPAMLEEALRWDGPVQLLFRQTASEFELPSGKISAGESVALLLGSANRDDAAFDEAERFDVTRESRGHLGFGFGVHFCLGASLARLEARVAMEALVPHLPITRHALPKTELIDSYLVRGPRSIELPAPGP